MVIWDKIIEDPKDAKLDMDKATVNAVDEKCVFYSPPRVNRLDFALESPVWLNASKVKLAYAL